MFPFHVVFSAGPIEDASLEAFVSLVRGMDEGSIDAEEVTLEPLPAWRREGDGWFRPAPGKECGLSLMLFWPEGKSPAWLAYFWDKSRNGFFAVRADDGAGYKDGMLCGAPARIQERCFLPVETCVGLAREFCDLADRPASCGWLEAGVAMGD